MTLVFSVRAACALHLAMPVGVAALKGLGLYAPKPLYNGALRFATTHPTYISKIN